MSDHTISAHALQQQLSDTQELAVLDVREARFFNQAHLNLARHAALSTLAQRIAQLVPRRTTAIVVIDDNDGAGAPKVPTLCARRNCCNASAIPMSGVWRAACKAGSHKACR